jgi:ankyrin repeat protein
MDPTMDAVALGSLERLKTSIRRDPYSVNRPVFSVTPAMCAAQKGNIAIVEYLLSIGGREVLDARDQCGKSIVHYAAEAGQITVLRFLVGKYGGSVIYHEDIYRETALHCAAKKGYADVVQYLLAVGGDAIANCRDQCGNAPVGAGWWKCFVHGKTMLDNTSSP